jgi:hypothetical protein
MSVWYVNRTECRIIVLSYVLFRKIDIFMGISGTVNLFMSNKVTLNHKDIKCSTAIIFFSNVRPNGHFNQYDTERN